MGWVWTDDDDGYFSTSSNPNGNGNGDGDRCATRKVVKSQCRTDEVEPGKFIRKCEKTEQIFKDCLGRPTEMVQSNKEITEEDVTDQMVKGSFPLNSRDGEFDFPGLRSDIESKGSFPLNSREGEFDFPGLRSDIESIERDFFGGINKFFEAAEEMKNEFFGSVGIPHTYKDDHRYSSQKRPDIHIESSPPKEILPKNNQDGDVDLSGLARDV